MDVVELTKDLIGLPSVSSDSNAGVSDFLAERFRELDFEVEYVEYQDAKGVRKVSVVGKKGPGGGGLGLFGHSDVVPAEGWEFDPFAAFEKEGRLYGRGSCDMKGPNACMLVAAEPFKASDLERPITMVFTADEEIGCGGAKAVAGRSRLFLEDGPEYGIIAEPTVMRVVHAHKGIVILKAVARGVPAHSSTGQGVNANLKMIPFLAEMKEIYDRLTTDETCFNYDFKPPFSDWNIGVSDGGVPTNITAPKSTCTINYRPMPGQDMEGLVQEFRDACGRHGLEAQVSTEGGPFFTPPDSPIVRAALEVTGQEKAATVSYGTDGMIFGPHLESILLGPGDIAQAHTIGEWIEIDQLHQAVDVYRKLIERFCAS